MLIKYIMLELVDQKHEHTWTLKIKKKENYQCLSMSTLDDSWWNFALFWETLKHSAQEPDLG